MKKSRFELLKITQNMKIELLDINQVSCDTPYLNSIYSVISAPRVHLKKKCLTVIFCFQKHFRYLGKLKFLVC